MERMLPVYLEPRSQTLLRCIAIRERRIRLWLAACSAVAAGRGTVFNKGSSRISQRVPDQNTSFKALCIATQPVVEQDKAGVSGVVADSRRITRVDLLVERVNLALYEDRRARHPTFVYPRKLE